MAISPPRRRSPGKPFPLPALRRLVGPQARLIGGAMIPFVIKQTPLWAVPILTGMIIDRLREGEAAEPYVWTMGAIMVVLVLQNVPSHAWFAVMASRATRNISLDLRAALVEQLQRLSILYHQQTPQGAVLSKVLRDVDAIELMNRRFLHDAPNAVLLTVVAVVTTLATEPLVTLFFLVAVPFAVLLAHWFRVRIQSQQSNYRVAVESFSSRVNDMVELIVVTRAHGLEKEEVRGVVRRLRTMRARALRLDFWTELFAASGWSSFQFALVSCLICCSVFAARGYVTVGQVVTYHGLFVLIVNAISTLLTTLPVFTQGIEALESVSEVLDSPEVDSQAGVVEVETLRGHIQLCGVSYVYPDSEQGVWDVDLDVRPGECVAFVGESGAGKSTLVNLILGFFGPQAGTVLADGQDYRDLDLRSLRRHVSVVPQSVTLFSGTIRENITYGLDDRDDRRLDSVLDMAQLRDVIQELPAGLDTPVGEKGARLSGGQKQRIAIARALIRDPRLLILDEATSALDVRSERKVQLATQELIRGRTTLIVAHRLSTIRMADRIVVMERGRIVELGSHRELLGLRGTYAELHDLSAAPG